MNYIGTIVVFLMFSTGSLLAQSWNWISESESNDSETFNSIAVDNNSGHIYAGGTIEDAAAFPQITAVFNDDDGVLLKYDLDGVIQWAFAIGGNEKDEILGVVVDTLTSNVFVTGYVERSGTISFEGAIPGATSTINLSGEDREVFTACYTSSGALVWFSLGGGTNDDVGIDIALNTSGVYVTGYYTDNASFGVLTSNISNSSTNFFVTAYDLTTGAEQWLNTMGSTSNDFTLTGSSSKFKERKIGVTADQNSVYCANYFGGLTYDIAHQSGNSSIVDATLSPEDIVAISFDNAGNFNWSTLYDNRSGSCNGASITNDCNGVYLTGTLSNLSISPGGTLLLTDGDNPFISRLNKSSGNEEWIIFLNSHISERDYFMDIAVDDFGYLQAVGIMRGNNVQIATHNETGGANHREPMIVKCRFDGVFQSFERIPSTDNSWAISAAVYEETQLYVAGEFEGTMDFGTFNSQPSPNDDAFLARFDYPKLFKYTSTVSLGPEFCSDESDPTPTFDSGTASGTFSGPPEIVFLDITTGEIDVSASTPGGPYIITFLNSTTSCKPYDASVEITILPADDASFSYSTNSYCLGDPNPTPTITTPGGTFLTTVGLIFVNTATGQIDLTNSTPGTYTVNYTTNSVNCPRTSSFNITISVQDDPTFSYSANAYCQDETNPTPTAVTTGGIYSGPAGVVFVSTSTGEIDLSTSTVGGPYAITYTTSGICPNSTTFNITIDAEDDPTFSYSANAYCQGETNPTPTAVTTGGIYSGPIDIVFVSTTTGEIDLSASTVGGPYAITYTTSGICPNSTTFNITIDAEDDPTFSYSTNAYCQGETNPTPTAVTTGGVYSGPAGVVFVSTSTGEIDLSASTIGGPYAITYTTSGICPNSTTFNITINAEDDPTFSYSANAYCQGETNPTPTAVTTGGIYSGPIDIVFVSTSTGEIDLSASTVGGPYAITYTTSGICPNSTTFNITIDAEDDPTFSYSANAYCQGETNPTPTAVTTGGVYSGPAGVVFVSTATGEIDLSASIAGGPYAITYTTSGICPNSTTFNITIDAEDDPTFSYSANAYCQGETNPTPTAVTTGGVYSGPAGVVFVSTTTGEIDLSASTAGGPYAITYTTSGICPNSTTFNITIDAEDDPTFSYSANAYCQGETNPTPTAITTGGVYSGPAGVVFLSTATGEIDLSLSTVGGPYAITYTTSGICPNSTTFNITIDAEDDPSFSYSANAYCQGETNPTPTAITTGGIYSGPAGVVFVSTATGEIDLSTSTVGGPYAITYTTSGICPNSTTFNITIDAEDDPSFSYSANAYCKDATNPIPSTVTPGGTFSGPAGIVFVSSATGEIDLTASTAGGPYSITYSTAGICPNSSIQTITINALETVTFQYEASAFCVSDENQLPVVTPTGGLFTVSTGLSLVNAATGEISPSSSTTETIHTVSYTSSGTCPSTIQQPILINAEPIADAGPDIELPFLFSTELNAETPVLGNGAWNVSNTYIIETTNDPQSTIRGLSLGLNEVVWTVENGTCPTAKDTVEITVLDLWIPQAVTPNNDGANDFFAFKSLDDVTCHLTVLNRWGQIVFESEDYQNDWQGTNMNGKLQPADTYFYVAIINDEKTYKGYIVLKP